MIKIPEDIIDKLKADFKDDFELAFKKLSSANQMYSDIRKERINRCIVHIANGSITELDNAIRIAKTDWRDAILCAEYEYVEGSSSKAIYDFTNGFNKI